MSGRPVRKGRSPSRKADEVAVKAPPTRAKSPGRPKSPGRQKSPGRPKSGKSPGRPKSPGRKAAKRSPSPTIRKSSLRVANNAGKKSVSQPHVNGLFVDLQGDKAKLAPYVAAAAAAAAAASSAAARREQSVSLEAEVIVSRERTLSVEATPGTLTRRSARTLARPTEALREENSVEPTINNVEATVNNRAGIVEVEPSQEIPREFGGWLGALLLIILIPLGVVISQLYCSKSKCPETSFPGNVSRNWRDYFDAKAAGVYAGFVTLQLIFSLLPLGRLVDAPLGRTSKFQYRCNGIYSLLLTAATIGGLAYFGVPVLSVLDKQLALAVSALVFGLLAAEILYVRGRRAPVAALNSYGDTGNFIVDFWMGREVNPRLFGRVDLKWVFYRVAVIGVIVVNALLVVKTLDSQTKEVPSSKGTGFDKVKVDWAEKNYPPALLLAAGLQIFYALDSLFFEREFPVTFDGHSEGLGYMMTVGLATYPFVPTIIVKFLTTNEESLPLFGLGLILAMHTVGYVINRSSSLQKSRFRQNPLDSKLSHVETIQTSRGKKLLVSGWWGWVRHPNYLGDLVMHWSWAACAGAAHWLPYTVPAAWTLLFLHRAVRDNARCQRRYGLAWERYALRVRHLVIPKVF